MEFKRNRRGAPHQGTACGKCGHPCSFQMSATVGAPAGYRCWYCNPPVNGERMPAFMRDYV